MNRLLPAPEHDSPGRHRPVPAIAVSTKSPSPLYKDPLPASNSCTLSFATILSHSLPLAHIQFDPEPPEFPNGAPPEPCRATSQTETKLPCSVRNAVGTCRPTPSPSTFCPCRRTPSPSVELAHDPHRPPASLASRRASAQDGGNRHPSGALLIARHRMHTPSLVLKTHLHVGPSCKPGPLCTRAKLGRPVYLSCTALSFE
jgi:hypothetical protein